MTRYILLLALCLSAISNGSTTPIGECNPKITKFSYLIENSQAMFNSHWLVFLGRLGSCDRKGKCEFQNVEVLKSAKSHPISTVVIDAKIKKPKIGREYLVFTIAQKECDFVPYFMIKRTKQTDKLLTEIKKGKYELVKDLF